MTLYVLTDSYDQVLKTYLVLDYNVTLLPLFPLDNIYLFSAVLHTSESFLTLT